MATPANPLPENVRAALERGSVIEAIKLLRETTGLGLKEAKDLIDQYQAGGTTSTAASAPLNTLPPDVSVALRRGSKIEAIRLLRDKTGLGLKEAKEAVEAFETATPVRRSQRTADGPGSGLWQVVAIVAVATLLYFIFSFGR